MVLPDTAYLLVSAATTLLRAAIESPQQAKIRCVRSLLGLSARLSAAKQTCSFDIGDFCLQRCKPTIDKLAAALGVQHVEDGSNAGSSEQSDAMQAEMMNIENPPLSLASDFLLPLDTLDYQFDLFDDLGTPWPIST